jgi:ribosomal protein S18 acetylase RimI-like enzyme
MYLIRPLGPDDVDAYRQVRLDALRLHPDAFGAAYEDELQLDRAQVSQRLSAPHFTRFGAFASVELVGLVGLQIHTGAKEQHKARLFSMYVDASHRRTGLAQQLIETVIAAAREAGALVLQLTVAAHNARAQQLYRHMGFTVYGVERRSLKVGDQFHDEQLMALDLD